MANVQLAVAPSLPGIDQSSIAALVARQVDTPSAAGIDPVAVLVTLVVAFSSGGSQVGLAIGPLENLYGSKLGLPGIVLLALGATGILAGAWMGAPKLLQATSREYAQLGVRRSIAAPVPGFIIAQLAIALGIPISFTNIIISGVIGGGLAGGSADGVGESPSGVSVSSLLVAVGRFRRLVSVLEFSRWTVSGDPVHLQFRY